MSVFFHDERRSNKNISGKIGRIEMVRGQKSKMAADTIAPIKTLATWTRARACTCAPRYARAKSWGRLFFEETGNVASRNNDRVENTS